MHNDQVANKGVTSGSHDYEGTPSLGLQMLSMLQKLRNGTLTKADHTQKKLHA